jgi:hypothetical protein
MASERVRLAGAGKLLAWSVACAASSLVGLMSCSTGRNEIGRLRGSSLDLKFAVLEVWRHSC